MRSHRSPAGVRQRLELGADALGANGSGAQHELRRRDTGSGSSAGVADRRAAAAGPAAGAAASRRRQAQRRASEERDRFEVAIRVRASVSANAAKFAAMVGRCVRARQSTRHGTAVMKRVLPRAQCRERRHVVGATGGPRALAAARLTAGIAARRNGLVACSSRDRRRQRRHAALALGLLARLRAAAARHCPARPRARSAGWRACTRGRSRRASPGGSAASLRQRRPHLRRRAFEQAAAAGGEQRVAAEHRRRVADTRRHSAMCPAV